MKTRPLTTLIAALTAAMLMLSIVTASAANSDPKVVPLAKVKYERHKQDTDEDGRRMPARPVACIISEDGISLDIPDEIETYEIWGIEEDVCIAAYYDEREFISHVYSVPGEYRIIFTTHDYYYMGYIRTL